MTDTITPQSTVDVHEDSGADTEAMVERLFNAVLGALEVQAAFLGDRLGWYEALADAPRTSAELAEATATDRRYAEEWLEHQTVAGFIRVDDPTAATGERRYTLPAAYRPVFADADDLSYLLPVARMVAGFGTRLEDLLDAYRTGEGLSWGDQGYHARESQAAANRPMFLNQLGPDYVASIPAAKAALDAGGTVADVGCGFGWSSIGVALAFPNATVTGFDVDEPSIEAARGLAEEYGVADRVTFELVDAGVPPTVGADEGFDLVMALECIHDLPHPVEVLSTMRDLTAPGGTTLVMDERVGHQFTGEPDPVEQLMYSFSLVCCLPDGRAHDHSAATGTVMRPSTLERYAVDAGFSAMTELDLEHDFFRFYRLEHEAE